ncbi:MAG: hypothetical protein L0G22_08920 [Propionibacteriaceae bacterium]|nr:hypothetical protein [Propionibacteriaceae bacterium]
MKTTIDIPDGLAAEAKALARDTGTSLRDLVLSGLRSEVTVRRAQPRADFSFPTVSGEGLVAELKPEAMIARSYGLPDA